MSGADNAAEVAKVAAIPREQWYWCGYPGHFIAASSCRYSLHTRIGAVIVSTVGDYWPRGEQGKRERIGCDREYETYVFLARDTARPEGEIADYGEIDGIGCNDSEEAERNHYAMCEKWAARAMQQEAVRAHLAAQENADA